MPELIPCHQDVQKISMIQLPGLRLNFSDGAGAERDPFSTTTAFAGSSSSSSSSSSSAAAGLSLGRARAASADDAEAQQRVAESRRLEALR